MPDKYAIGRQPCQKLHREGEGSYFGANVHECYGFGSPTHECFGTVSFCLNCHRDHHSGGYETCGNTPLKAAQHNTTTGHDGTEREEAGGANATRFAGQCWGGSDTPDERAREEA